MAKKSTRTTRTRTVYRTAPRKKRRTSTLNRSVKKPMQALGVTVGLASVYGPAIVASVKGMSTKPIAGAIMNKDAGIQAIKNVATGYLVGTGAGIIADKSGLKKPINKALRTVRGII